MKTEIKINLCQHHKGLLDLREYYPEYIFSDLIFFPARTCRVPQCSREAYHTCIGLKIPNGAGSLSKESIWELEIVSEAKQLLDGGLALDRLSYFLKTKIVPSQHREFLADKLIRHHARMILDKCKIDPSSTISDRDKGRLLLELGLLPE